MLHDFHQRGNHSLLRNSHVLKKLDHFNIFPSSWHGHCILIYLPTLEETMKNPDLSKKLAKLETINDQLAAEISYLDQLARSLGFAEGLKTLKSAALEMLETDKKRIDGRRAKDSKAIEETDF
jgi:hypothetical protein